MKIDEYLSQPNRIIFSGYNRINKIADLFVNDEIKILYYDDLKGYNLYEGKITSLNINQNQNIIEITLNQKQFILDLFHPSYYKIKQKSKSKAKEKEKEKEKEKIYKGEFYIYKRT